MHALVIITFDLLTLPFSLYKFMFPASRPLYIPPLTKDAKFPASEAEEIG
jgi:hypothetical protein